MNLDIDYVTLILIFEQFMLLRSCPLRINARVFRVSLKSYISIIAFLLVSSLNPSQSAIFRCIFIAVLIQPNTFMLCSM